jgi:hypothetical protein
LTLGSIGEEAKAALPLLREIVRTDPEVRWHAQVVIEGIEKGSP